MKSKKKKTGPAAAAAAGDKNGEGSGRASTEVKDVEVGGTGDKTRDRTRKLLFEKLGDVPSDIENPVMSRSQLANAIETAMIEEFKVTNANYKSKYRDLASNLADERNKDLNSRIFNGEVTPKVLITLSALELAAEELNAERKKVLQDSLDARRTDWGKDKGVTEMFKCGKCKQRKCTYYQMQTRSADEPMTTFITCTNCGNKWRE